VDKNGSVWTSSSAWSWVCIQSSIQSTERNSAW